VGKAVRDSVRDVQAVVEVGGEAGLPVECTISSAFGDPFEGEVPPSRVVEVAGWVVDAGVEGLSLGDTVGVATPLRVWAVVQELREALPELRLNLHFHDTRGAGMANVLAALQLGCNEFDGSVGGIGGSPFAPGAGGNVATEELVDMLGDMGISTGIHGVEGLVEIAQYVETLLERPLPSRVMRAGSRPRPGSIAMLERED
jgi:hydroxymethylglutaryl-CoA lyase